MSSLEIVPRAGAGTGRAAADARYTSAAAAGRARRRRGGLVEEGESVAAKDEDAAELRRRRGHTAGEAEDAGPARQR